MVIDRTYIPLRAEFSELLTTTDTDLPLTTGHILLLQRFYFEGAASAYHLVKEYPEIADTIESELLDFAEQYA